MLEVAEKSRSEFDFESVDFYDNESVVFFGEVTFHPEGETRVLPRRHEIESSAGCGEYRPLPAGWPPAGSGSGGYGIHT